MTHDVALAWLTGNRPVQTVAPDASVREAAQRMVDAHVGSLVVVADEVPVGMVTDRDLVVRVLGHGLSAETSRVEELMSSPAITVEAGASLGEAAALLRRFGIRRLPMVDERGALAGIVTADDLLLLLGDRIHDAAGAVRRGLENESSPPQPYPKLGRE